MRIIDEDLLREFGRMAPYCEVCARSGPCDAAHVYSRGAGRLDIRINLIALCRGFYRGGWHSCHQDYDHGRIPRETILRIVAKREGMTPEAIIAEIHRLRRLTKEGKEPHEKTR